MKRDSILIGPFSQVVTMDNMALGGPLRDDDLEIIPEGGIVLRNGTITAIDRFDELRKANIPIEEPAERGVLVPGMIDAHSHICWAGSREEDYAKRLSGKSYADIASEGGGIWSTVLSTREAGAEELINLTCGRADRMFRQGITTIEVKSGYGLDAIHELKILECIKQADARTSADLIPTCLAAHTKPRDYSGNSLQYLEMIIDQLLPEIRNRSLSNRVDIYVDKNAFTVEEARYYLTEAERMGFEILLHADQFTSGGARLAAELKALSADHLEITNDDDIAFIAKSGVIPVVLPGASMGLGTGFAPARKLLDAGAPLVVASDWNPGSAPMGHLLLQSSVLAVYEKLTMAETLAAVTSRAAAAVGLKDRGIIRLGMFADLVAFPCKRYKEILYNQGSLLPVHVWKKGIQVI